MTGSGISHILPPAAAYTAGLTGGTLKNLSQQEEIYRLTLLRRFWTSDSTMGRVMSNLLENIRVIDGIQWQQVPVAGLKLGDLGAKVKLIHCPIKYAKTPGTLRLPAPEFGPHTEEVLTEILGYGWDQISALKEQEVI